MDIKNSPFSLITSNWNFSQIPNLGMGNTQEDLNCLSKMNSMPILENCSSSGNTILSYLWLRKQFEADFDRWYLTSNFCMCSKESQASPNSAKPSGYYIKSQL